jgi:hypothetical protein
MNRRGVNYDVGRVLWRNWRPEFNRDGVREDLRVIRDDLHCDAVKLGGRDLDRLVAASEEALGLGLEVWFSPELWGRPPGATLTHIARAAGAAERLNRHWPDRVVFSVATEATLFVRGIIPGFTFHQRIARLRSAVRDGRHVDPLQSFLERAVRRARAVFGGPVTYASLPFEPVDWSLFDIVSVDHYRDSRTEAGYRGTLDRLVRHGRPVVVTEFGMRTYRGAGTDGKLGTGISADRRTRLLHPIPGVGRLIRPRLGSGGYLRDETYQARRIVEDLEILDEAGVDGAFVCTFAEPLLVHDPDPWHDLDRGSLALVKTRADGTWERKESFRSVADFYGRVDPAGR